MPAHARILPQVKEALIQVPGLDRRQPQSFNGSIRQEITDQIRDRFSFTHVAAPGTQVHTGKDNFLRIAFHCRLHVLHHTLDRCAYCLPSRHPRDTKSAQIVASILYF